MNKHEEQVLESMCRERGCMNYRARGFLICVSCLYGTAVRATEEDQAIKRAYEKKLKAKE